MLLRHVDTVGFLPKKRFKISYVVKLSLNSIYVSVLFNIAINQAYAIDFQNAPPSIPGTTKVTAEGVLDLADRFLDLIIVDARIRADRKQGYIEGSISLPDVETDCKSLKVIIPNKNYPVLFYCNGVKCGRSVNSSRIALECGYSDIYWFRGGFEEWNSKNLPFIKS